MDDNNLNWLGIIKSIDPGLEKSAKELNNSILEKETEIPKKYKELILLACLAVIGNQAGIRHQGYEAMHQGATDKEIIEVLALASLASGTSTLAEGISVLKDQFTV